MLILPCSLVCQLFHLFTAAAMQWGCAIKGVAVLQAAVERYRLSPHPFGPSAGWLWVVGGSAVMGVTA